MKKLLVLLVAVAIAGFMTAAPAHAAIGTQCLIKTNGTDKSGNLIIVSDTCYDTLAQVLTAAGGKNVPSDITASTESSFLASPMDLGIIGTHYDGSSGGGASVSVQGSDCLGGGLNLPASWNDKISSTLNGCPLIKHFENSNYTGTEADTFGAGVLSNISGYMNNRTTSVLYSS